MTRNNVCMRPNVCIHMCCLADNRGDVGSWCREAGLRALQRLVELVGARDVNLLARDLVEKVMRAVVKQLVRSDGGGYMCDGCRSFRGDAKAGLLGSNIMSFFLSLYKLCPTIYVSSPNWTLLQVEKLDRTRAVAGGVLFGTYI
jgi:hypothetical protein